MAGNFYRDTWAEIDLNAIRDNVTGLTYHLPSRTKIMAVVKADGYGHGAVETAKTSLESGAKWLGVALLDEAIALRNAGITAPILVLGWVRPEDVNVAADNHISVTVFQDEWLEQASRNLTSPQPLFIHLKIDSGMARVGVRSEAELSAFINTLQEDSRIILEGTYTHFATADEKDSSYFQLQYQRFETMLKHLRSHSMNPNIIHCGNSAAALNYPDKMFDMVRFGISMYGLSPSEEMKENLPFKLKEAFSLRSRIIHVKQLPPGESISYGSTYTTKENEWIGTIPIGYGDGWVRRLAKVDVIVGEDLCPVAGRICMDQMMCRLPYKVPIGTPVTIIGRSPDNRQRISVDKIAAALDTINYEVPCLISNRVPRLYSYNGKTFR